MKNNLKPTNPKDRAATSRLDITLFPQTAIAYGALAMTEGDCKYGGYNYRVGGVLASVYVAALFRHISKWYNGEWEDAATTIPHLASAIACLAVILDAYESNVLVDDRPPKVDLNALLHKFEAKVAKLHKLFPNGPQRHTQLALKEGKHGHVKSNMHRKAEKKKVSKVQGDWIRTKKAR